MDYDVFVSIDGETGQFSRDYDDPSLAIAHAAALWVSGAYARVTLYHFDTVIKNWSRPCSRFAPSIKDPA
jgi:hypothetical protein